MLGRDVQENTIAAWIKENVRDWSISVLENAESKKTITAGQVVSVYGEGRQQMFVNVPSIGVVSEKKIYDLIDLI